MVNEIFYRTLLNRLYLLQSNDIHNKNYGIGNIYGSICIYSIIEHDIVGQIINMQKFNFKLLQMDENKVHELFGINYDIEKESFIYNNLLNSISKEYSSISEIYNIKKLEEVDASKMYTSTKIEKNLVDLSSELPFLITSLKI